LIEEEDEDFLNKKKSKKSIIKSILIFILIIIGVIILVLGNVFGVTYLFWVGVSIMCIASFFLNVKKRPKEPLTQTLCVLRCDLCDYTKVQDYEEGDFVFKVAGKCSKCDGSMKINDIYTVKIKKEKS